MMAFLRAHGLDAGPLQRPLLAGAITGLVATVPAGAVFVALGSFAATDAVLRLPRPAAAAVLVAAFTASGALYGLVLQRAANDRRGGFLFGMVFAFVLWMAAPVVVLPLLGGRMMAAGLAAAGFFAGFLVWGAALGALFPIVHRPLHVRLESGRDGRHAGAFGAVSPLRLLRRPPRR
ncbi:hypothetical protein [Phenylobacterium sp.]|uniref:hypothetical protein n=1 Tax=Phenylobacterium sp. TaxID=1871053 RepID=UPI002C34B8C4|nr:hypothetical protein [Phenylobacterium sp.]HVI31262.1 hypothetical protein [Phenylobacterium sp.]